MPHKILVVDDDKLNNTLVKFALSEARYEVVVAVDGYEGLEAFEQEVPDLIVLDVQMPVINGYEFVEELKKRQLAVFPSIIMLTANETMEDVFRLEGVKDYFVKPIDPPKLVQKITSYLGENPID